VSETIFGLRVQPNAAPQAHFLTGYVIQAGHAVIAYPTIRVTSTPNQAMILWLTGYQPKPWVFWRTKAARANKPMIRPNVPPS